MTGSYPTIKLFVLFYYICFPQDGAVVCTDYVPLMRYERFADCRADRNLYLRGPLRYWQAYGADGDAKCVELDTGVRRQDYAPLPE